MIDGVKILSLNTHIDKRGFFREIFRFPSDFKEKKISQLSHSLVEEIVIKCWHGHVYQYQWNYVVSGKIKVGLFDNRDDSETFRETMEFFSGIESSPTAYFFPPGVFHGYKCIEGPLNIIYVTSGTYDLKDELRRSDDDLNIKFSW